MAATTQLAGCDPGAVARAAQLLRDGELVAFPTETVYGLGARADCAKALRRLYQAKQRPLSKALIMLVRDTPSARALASHWPPEATRLAERFWPGPLTLVVRRGPDVLDEISAGGATVALRVPSHPACLDLLGACEFPVAGPSANRHGQPPPRSGAEVRRALGDAVSFILDAGELPLVATTQAPASTIVDLTQDPPVVLREGLLAAGDIARACRGAPKA